MRCQPLSYGANGHAHWVPAQRPPEAVRFLSCAGPLDALKPEESPAPWRVREEAGPLGAQGELPTEEAGASSRLLYPQELGLRGKGRLAGRALSGSPETGTPAPTLANNVVGL